MENTTVTSVPEITRMIAHIEDWKEEREKARGRAETERALGEAHKLDEISNMLTRCDGSCSAAADSSDD